MLSIRVAPKSYLAMLQHISLVQASTFELCNYFALAVMDLQLALAISVTVEQLSSTVPALRVSFNEPRIKSLAGVLNTNFSRTRLFERKTPILDRTAVSFGFPVQAFKCCILVNL